MDLNSTMCWSDVSIFGYTVQLYTSFLSVLVSFAVDEDFNPISKYQGHPSLATLVRVLRQQLSAMPRVPFTHHVLSEKNWWVFCCLLFFYYLMFFLLILVVGIVGYGLLLVLLFLFLFLLLFCCLQKSETALIFTTMDCFKKSIIYSFLSFFSCMCLLTYFFCRFHYSARTWEAVKKSNLIAEYHRLLST